MASSRGSRGQKEIPPAALIADLPHSKDTAVIDGLNVYPGRIGFDPVGSANPPPSAQVRFTLHPSPIPDIPPSPPLFSVEQTQTEWPLPGRLPSAGLRRVVVRSCPGSVSPSDSAACFSFSFFFLLIHVGGCRGGFVRMKGGLESEQV